MLEPGCKIAKEPLELLNGWLPKTAQGAERRDDDTVTLLTTQD